MSQQMFLVQGPDCLEVHEGAADTLKRVTTLLGTLSQSSKEKAAKIIEGDLSPGRSTRTMTTRPT